MVKYDTVIFETSKPVKERGAILVTKSGALKVPRKYHLDADVIEKKQKELGRTFFNPYKKGVLWGIVETLYILGPNQRHPYLQFRVEFENVMKNNKNVSKNRTLWESFTGRKVRNASNSRDTNGKIMANANMLQRIDGFHPYGYKLKQVKAYINIYKGGNGLPEYELRTDQEEIHLINEMHREKSNKTLRLSVVQ